MPQTGSVGSYQKEMNSGEVVQVRDYQRQQADAADAITRVPGRPPLAAKMGQFPLGRTIPGYFPDTTKEHKTTMRTRKKLLQHQKKQAKVDVAVEKDKLKEKIQKKKLQMQAQAAKAAPATKKPASKKKGSK